MSAGGGAEANPKTQHEVQQRVFDLLLRAVRQVPKRHRTGWYAALARYAKRPLTPEPNAAELAYYAWSAKRLAGPKRQPPAPTDKQPQSNQQGNPAHPNARSPKPLTTASTQLAHSTTQHSTTTHKTDTTGSPSNTTPGKQARKGAGQTVVTDNSNYRDKRTSKHLTGVCAETGANKIVLSPTNCSAHKGFAPDAQPALATARVGSV